MKEKKTTKDKLTCLSINQSINHSVNELTKQRFNQSVNQSASQLAEQHSFQVYGTLIRVQFARPTLKTREETFFSPLCESRATNPDKRQR